MGIAIITGGSRGLGAALCDLYRERGWRVLEFSRSAPHPYSVRLDLSDIRNVPDALGEELRSLAAFDAREVVAIGNASMLGPVGPVEGSSPEEIATHLHVNVVSAVLFARAFVEAFQGHTCPKTFVNISSGAANRGSAGWSLYGASKAALENFVRAVALEQEGHTEPIRAISINPGVMDTVMQEEVRNSRPEDFPAVERYARLHREGRLATASSVASQIAEIVASRPESGGVYPAQ